MLNRMFVFLCLGIFNISALFAIDVPMHSNRVITTTQTTVVKTYAGGSEPLDYPADQMGGASYIDPKTGLLVGALVGLTAGVLIGSAQQNYYDPWFNPWPPFWPVPHPFWPGPGPFWPVPPHPWAPHPWGPHPWSPSPWSPHPWSPHPWAPHPWSPHPWSPHPWQPYHTGGFIGHSIHRAVPLHRTGGFVPMHRTGGFIGHPARGIRSPHLMRHTTPMQHPWHRSWHH